MLDDTEETRRVLQMINNTLPIEELTQPGEKLWTPSQLSEEFTVLGFAAPFVVVQRKSDGKKGYLEFKHSPRVYFNWVEGKP